VIRILATALLALGLAGSALAQDDPASTDPADTDASTAESPAPGPPPTTPTLDAAYQKEFAYLLAEKEALQQRLSQEKARAREAISTARGELDRLQGRLIRLQTEAEQAELKLQDVERAATAALEGQDMVANAVFQARNSLDREGFELPTAEEDTLEALAPVLGAAFDEGVVRIDEGRSVRKVQGMYFLQDGTQVQGEILQVGNIASYGLSNAGQGVLKPVGKNRLQLWRGEGRSTAEALAGGQDPATLEMFLYESAKKGVSEAPEKTWAGYVEGGGLAGLVILFLGVLAVILVIARSISLSLVGGSGRAFVEKVADHLRAGDREGAAKVASGGRGAVGRVTRKVVENHGRPREELEDVVGEAILAEQPRIDRFSTAILVIAAVAPLMGLLGTVTGMIATFDIITEFGTGDPRRLSGGISEALITTQLGLIVAIPSLLVGNVLSAWGGTVMTRVERSALHLLNVEVGDTPSPVRGGGPELREVQASHG
jgi:biopolymer transport protein ExbB